MNNHSWNHTACVIPRTERRMEEIRHTLGRYTEQDNLVPDRVRFDLIGEQGSQRKCGWWILPTVKVQQNLIPACVCTDIASVIGPEPPECCRSQAKLLRIVGIRLGANPLFSKKQHRQSDGKAIGRLVSRLLKEQTTTNNSVVIDEEIIERNLLGPGQHRRRRNTGH